MPKCPNCGSIYEEGTNYCPECGQPIESEEKEKVEESEKRKTKKKKGLVGLGKFAIFIMVVGFFVAFISYRVDNNRVLLWGVEAFVVGLSIFIAVKWKSKKVYITAGSLLGALVLFNLGLYLWQHRSIEIEKINEVKCEFCDRIVKSDTSIITKTYIKVKDKNYILSSRDTVCDSCRNSAEGIFNEGKSEYWQGDYDNALIKFRAASQRQYRQANEWIDKTKEVKQKKKEVKQKKEERERKQRLAEKKRREQEERQREIARENKLKNAIQELKNKGLIYKIEKYPDGCDVYVSTDYYALSIDNKKQLARGIWTYYRIRKDPDMVMVIIYDKYSGKKIGKYAKYGYESY